MAEKTSSKTVKSSVKQARATTKQARNAAENALQDNKQFTNPKFWASLDVRFVSKIAKAIAKAEKVNVTKELKRAERNVARLRKKAGKA